MNNKKLGGFEKFLGYFIAPLSIMFCFSSNNFGWEIFWIIVELSFLIQLIPSNQTQCINSPNPEMMHDITNIIRTYNYNRLKLKSKIINLVRTNKIAEAIDFIKAETTISDPQEYIDSLKTSIDDEELKINKALELMRVLKEPINLSSKHSTYEDYISSKMGFKIQSNIGYKTEFNKLALENILNYSLEQIDNFDFDTFKNYKSFDLSKPPEGSEDFEIWEELKNEFFNEQASHNAKIQTLKEAYKSKSTQAISKYIEKILNYSKYPKFMQKNFDVLYNADNKTLLVDIQLPFKDVLPQIKETTYNKTKKDFTHKYYSEKELNVLYEELLYKIILRTIYEIFLTDNGDFIESVVLNGIVEYIDKTDGHNKSSCIASIQTNKDEFMNLNLKNVDVKACYKKLKGIIAPIDKGMIAIKPIMQLNKYDRRFIDAYGVMENVNEGTNLASMDWQDFENLIREIFEKEFSKNGGEVKVTQSSRDGGVDAIAFDPDPILGGKVIIQAKRYTNIVGVSAVRDLYGTLINEGANKGILITTSDYGPDAFNFSKDKPITLLNGNNLLHLMNKYGHKAYIDLKEAKDRMSKT